MAFKKFSQLSALIPFSEIKTAGCCPCSEKCLDFLISKPLNNSLFSLALWISKKYFNVDIFKVFPNLLGRMKSFTLEPSSKMLAINLVLSI